MIHILETLDEAHQFPQRKSLRELFTVSFSVHTVCTVCGNSRCKHEDDTVVKLSFLGQTRSIQAAVDKFQEMEDLEEVHCDHCKRQTTQSRRIVIKASQVLLIYGNRLNNQLRRSHVTLRPIYLSAIHKKYLRIFFVL